MDLKTREKGKRYVESDNFVTQSRHTLLLIFITNLVINSYVEIMNLVLQKVQKNVLSKIITILRY